MRILVVEDETKVARALREGLEREKYEVVVAPVGSPRKERFRCLALAMLAASFCAFAGWARAQSPELSMREFSSGQIKKGVRSIGFGGDGATWGNYGLVWLDASTVLADYGDTHYTNGNDFHFYAVGITTPPLWHRLAIYVIAMSQDTNDVRLSVKSPGLGPGAVPVIGTGSDTAVFSKIALPLGKGFSAGVLLSHETSHFDATAQQNSQLHVLYQTEWRPSGGFGIAWQPSKRLLLGFRGLLDNDLEQRTDPVSVSEGLARTQEYRLGGSVSPWNGALAQPASNDVTLSQQPIPLPITQTWASSKRCSRSA